MAQAPKTAPEEARDIVIDIDVRWGDRSSDRGRSWSDHAVMMRRRLSYTSGRMVSAGQLHGRREWRRTDDRKLIAGDSRATAEEFVKHHDLPTSYIDSIDEFIRAHT